MRAFFYAGALNINGKLAAFFNLYLTVQFMAVKKFILKQWVEKVF